MSRASEISTAYRDALNIGRDQYNELVSERLSAAEEFYEQFLSTQIVHFRKWFASPRGRDRLQEYIERYLGTRRLQFIAIDGTCRREQFSDMLTFFGGAYGARGELELDSGDHRVQYKRWSLDQDVSMVAWVPIPFARLEEVQPQGEQFLATNEEEANVASVHTQIMQLAEIFLAINAITSSALDAPHLVLMDLLPSSVLANVAQAQDRVGLVGYPYDRRELTKADIAIAYAQPVNDILGIPSSKNMDRPRTIIASLLKEPTQRVDLNAIAQAYGVEITSLRRALSWLVRRGVLDENGNPLVNVRESWDYTKALFQNICKRLFLEKDPTALQYETTDYSGVLRKHWMSSNDLNFLVAVGMRLLIEVSWERKVLLYGIIKDSASRYFGRNYFGVTLETGFHPQLSNLTVNTLPWTDRMLCEALPRFDDSIEAPWATIEFDSAFMTLHRERDETGETQVGGVMGRIVNQEHLFMKSLGQFFLSREKRNPLMGHVVFIERLLQPFLDSLGSEASPAEILIETDELGRIKPFAWRDAEHLNRGQTVMMYLLSVLTKNHFAEAIGYPDPLHKADWGAKSMGRWVGKTIESSTRVLSSNPLSDTFRTTRDSAKR